MFAGEKRKQ